MKNKLEHLKDFTVSDVAEILQCSTRFVRELIKTKKLAAYRPGLRAWRITRAALDQYRVQCQLRSYSEMFDDSDNDDEDLGA